MFLGAMAALAVAGVAAGTLYMHHHLTGRRSATGDGPEEGHDKRRKDLRRKRGYRAPQDCLCACLPCASSDTCSNNFDYDLLCTL